RTICCRGERAHQLFRNRARTLCSLTAVCSPRAEVSVSSSLGGREQWHRVTQRTCLASSLEPKRPRGRCRCGRSLDERFPPELGFHFAARKRHSILIDARVYPPSRKHAP